MIFQCHDLDRALATPELMPDARAHAERCPACAGQLFLWSEISRVAPQLHEEWDSPALWPRIQSAVAAAPAQRRPVPLWRWTLAAAAMVTLAAALSQPWRSAAPHTSDFLTQDALRDVQQAEAAYSRSIDRLSAVAGPSLERSPSPLAALYREKLVVLDSAISDLQQNVESNRYNIYLQGQLASLYREKQRTLREWMENANRN
jgi:alkanesulfonate monooxygenase SsuD/methylene tetrahydromethanopterin reductase-like flavin-dependent oxidoreductase (luciferase family)